REAEASFARTDQFGSMAMPDQKFISGSVPRLFKTNTWTGLNNFTSTFQINGTTETFPSSGILVGTTDNQTLTNKSIAASEINSGNLAIARLPTFTQAMQTGVAMNSFGGL